MKYFLHDSNSFSDDKITMLFIEYGFEGLGLFYTILEKLAFQEKPIPEEVLKKQLGIRKKLQKQIDFMYEIDLLSLKNGEVSNKNILKNTEKYQEKKEKNAKRISQWREKQEGKKNVTHYKSVRNTDNISKDNISKDNISKDNISKDNISKDILLTLENEKLKLEIDKLKNQKNNSEIEFKETNESLTIFSSLLKFISKVTGKGFRVVNEKAKNQIKARLKEGYTQKDFEKAIENCANNEYHQKNPHFLTLEFISRPDKLEKYLNAGTPKAETNEPKQTFTAVKGRLNYDSDF